MEVKRSCVRTWIFLPMIWHDQLSWFTYWCKEFWTKCTHGTSWHHKMAHLGLGLKTHGVWTADIGTTNQSLAYQQKVQGFTNQVIGMPHLEVSVSPLESEAFESLPLVRFLDFTGSQTHHVRLIFHNNFTVIIVLCFFFSHKPLQCS